MINGTRWPIAAVRTETRAQRCRRGGDRDDRRVGVARREADAREVFHRRIDAAGLEARRERVGERGRQQGAERERPTGAIHEGGR
jgi:hypothetical protein